MLTRTLSPARLLALSLVLALLGLAQARASSDDGQAGWSRPPPFGPKTEAGPGEPGAMAGRSASRIPAAPLP
ncbi:hypothetical protein [Methylobacterium oryzisoli]|uniref:hypothetical protein n=1 Tax=Methylobacterium oryzisoli TaxID=3385502 RepID=UPI003891450F